jgi:hypothetical protein
MNHSFSAAYLLIFLALCLAVGSGHRQQPIEHPFPMTPGTFWVYQGTIQFTQSNGQSSETAVTWRTEIKRVIQRGTLSAAVVNNFPPELNWTDGHPEPADSLLIEDSGKFYYISSERFQDAVQRLERPSDNLDGLRRDDDLILEWPLVPGQKYACDARTLARPDNMYCWMVSSLGHASLQGVSGISAGERAEYQLTFTTNPDDTEFSFVPWIGITKYAYHHHGTVARTDLQLLEFHSAGANHD